MRVLWIGTKPPWPPVDGGRLAAALTLEALAAAGVELTVRVPRVVPWERAPAGIDLASVPVRPTSWWRAAPRAWLEGGSATLERHRNGELAREVAESLQERRPDVVHVEQLQALAQAGPAAAAGIPVVLRAQNVESDLWLGAADLATGLRGQWLAREGRRLGLAEGTAVRQVSAALALTVEDAERLSQLAGGATGRVATLAVPHPAELSPGPVVSGAPAVVIVGSGGWLPNRAGARWFVEEVWPRVMAANPAARLHVFGESPSSPAGVIVRPPPADSAEAFPRGAILAVPLAVASGVRMKILEAWARGLPVVATPAAASGLAATPGCELAVAGDARGFAAALLELGADPDRAARQVAAGRDLLRSRHDPARIAARLVAIYGAARSRAMNSS